MSTITLILIYSIRILKREWRKFILPFLSLLITAVVLSLMFLLTESGRTLLNEKARELTGGDINIETSTPIDAEGIIRELDITTTGFSLTQELNLTLLHNNETSPVSLRVVDAHYPLYGNVVLGQSDYQLPGINEIFLDQNALDKLGADVGDIVMVGNHEFIIRDVLVREPTSLFGGFRFLPRAIMSEGGFARLMLDPSLLRITYEYNYRTPTLTRATEDTVLAYAEQNKLHLHLASNSHGGRQAGFGIITNFLVLAVLITCVLAAVNVYAGTLHLLRMEQKSFAILLALGLPHPSISGVLGSALFGVTALAVVIGTFVGALSFEMVRSYGKDVFDVSLPIPPYALPITLTFVLVLTTAIASFLPAVRSLFSLSQRDILTHTEEGNSKKTTKTVFSITLVTLMPLFVLSSILLRDIVDGLSALLIVGGVYVLIAILFTLLLTYLYKKRSTFPFLIRSIVSHKKAEGIFGIISFTSLFIALTSLGTLSLTQATIERYLTQDLNASIPTTYILDVQPSQESALVSQFPELTLFPNIGSRILSIDGLQIQDALARGEEGVDRELGREYNLTYRTKLLSSETIVDGETHVGKPGEISVDEEFAKRARIRLGSRITFLIQGFEVQGIVTSLRETDSRSGLPFFYFILSPDDVRQFPYTSFGYSFYDNDRQRALGTFIGERMPNISMIETESLAPEVKTLTNTLLTLILVIAFPPLLLAVLLIATLAVSNYESRKREGARLQALGATRIYVMREYLAETLSLTVASSIIAYGVSLLATAGLSLYYLRINTIIVFERDLVVGFGLIILTIGAIGTYLYTRNKISLRELLSEKE